MLTMLVVDVLPSLSVPLQLATTQPEAGLAVNWINDPVAYCPAGHATEPAGQADGSLPEPACVRVRRKHGGAQVTVAVWLLAGMFTVFVVDVLESLIVPFQLATVQSAAGLAVT